MRTTIIPAFGLLASLVASGPARAQTYTLAESPREDECFRITTETNLGGTLKVTRDGKPVTVRISATNEHTFAERLLAADNRVAKKALRRYSTAVSRATMDGDRVERNLPAEHRLIVAQRTADSLLCYSPDGRLTRTEVEVVSEHFETLHLTGLLPGKDVTVGESWKVDSGVAQSVCLFDGLISHTLTAKLKNVAAGMATIAIEGGAKGIENGALAELTVAAEVRFDLEKKRILNVVWKQKDVRDQGPVSPAAEVETTTVLKRELLAEPPAELGPAAMARVLAEEPARTAYHLLHRDPRNRFQFLYARDWHIVGQTEHHIVMRLLDRGDFVAQVTVTQWQNAGAGKHISPEDFEKLTAGGTGWKPEEVLERGEVPTDGGRWVYHVTARGELEGSKVVQNFYVVASADGDQMILTFTMRPASATRIGTRDLALVNAIEFQKK
jgi:hypothetical protein